MSTLREEIALERLAVGELDAESAELWRNKHYEEARGVRQLALEKRVRIEELERRVRAEAESGRPSGDC
jgi:hypothetical protein